MAASACRTSSSALAPCDGAIAMPTLQVSVNWAPSRLQGCATTFKMRRAVASAASASAGATTTANWSPPRRASRSSCRRQPWMRWATSSKTRSPISWPRLSLTCLKRSRSTTSKAREPPLRCASITALATTSVSRRRLATPVSGSCRLSDSMRCWSASRSVRSRNDQTRPVGLPALKSGRVTRSNTWPDTNSRRSVAAIKVACAKARSRLS